MIEYKWFYKSLIIRKHCPRINVVLTELYDETNITVRQRLKKELENFIKYFDTLTPID